MNNESTITERKRPVWKFFEFTYILSLLYTPWKVSKYGVISGPLFTEEISVFFPNTGKYRPEITPYLDTFHAVVFKHYNLMFYPLKSKITYKNWQTKKQNMALFKSVQLYSGVYFKVF